MTLSPARSPTSPVRSVWGFTQFQASSTSLLLLVNLNSIQPKNRKPGQSAAVELRVTSHRLMCNFCVGRQMVMPTRISLEAQ
jgi:hypothetical protein